MITDGQEIAVWLAFIISCELPAGQSTASVNFGSICSAHLPTRNEFEPRHTVNVDNT
jgi:hypothetical protein